mmetsp:Transcript_17267/g.26155  ORF Transcript_17267/g.26155 Transcript_17267/m.26155 type:complete len:136 (-) Transcript_17267:311-718(-)|eukprot:CAMPEP_0194203492 /NCGR_PEP_ID=MMETSP0156-20130528/3247_1 /TAXON_ID=33649 /ORGANISM="Thalassionema nitzschioides, Strain L26-B" /LENGTH=135 /DNA_ID=CAMNT_0038929249 /DNA_START=769 /DNA_END=1176 /DNA_ORIENTATION=-
MGKMLEWSDSQVDALVNRLSQLSQLLSLIFADSALTDGHLRWILPRLMLLKCLDVKGRFGNNVCDCPLTDVGMKVISDNYPKLLSLTVDDQGKASVSEIMAIVKKCPELLDLSVDALNIKCASYQRDCGSLAKTS